LARKRKYPPLTIGEIELAKRVNVWIGNRKRFTLPTDSAGQPFTTKNLADQCDQYLLEHARRIELGNQPVDAPTLTTLMRRYYRAKGNETAAKNLRKKQREKLRQLHAAQDAVDRAVREEKKRQRAEQAARQGSFEF